MLLSEFHKYNLLSHWNVQKRAPLYTLCAKFLQKKSFRYEGGEILQNRAFIHNTGGNNVSNLLLEPTRKAHVVQYDCMINSFSWHWRPWARWWPCVSSRSHFVSWQFGSSCCCWCQNATLCTEHLLLTTTFGISGAHHWQWWWRKYTGHKLMAVVRGDKVMGHWRRAMGLHTLLTPHCSTA